MGYGSIVYDIYLTYVHNIPLHLQEMNFTLVFIENKY